MLRKLSWPIIVLGIDPGTRRVGFGVISCAGKNPSYIDAGLISPIASAPSAALSEMKTHIDILLEKYTPDLLALEKIFFSKNQKTAIDVAQARGVILLAAGERRIPVLELTPKEVKTGITGYGSADKRAVSKMVKVALKIPSLKVLDDVTDALAIAIVANDLHRHMEAVAIH